MRQVKEFDTADGTRYRVRYRIGDTETSETFRRKRDAEMFRDLLGNGRDGRVVEALGWLRAKQEERETITLGEWFEVYVDQLTDVTLRTRADYRAQHRRYLTHLDATPLPLLTRSQITSTVNRLEQDGRSPKTIKNVINTLSSALGLAVDEGHLARNPCRRVRLPKMRLDEHEVRFLTHEEAGRLVAAFDPYYQPLVAFLFGTGLRWSEATALQARHVNLEAGTVRVERAWKRIPGGFEIGPPKTDQARRTVNAAVPALVAVQPLLRRPSDLVFQTPRGNVVRHSNFYTRYWQPAAERSGLDPKPSPHDCRHSFASWLISDGCILEQVQDQLGHTSILTTRSVYGHLLPALGVAAGLSASAAMERVLSAAALPQPVELGVGRD